MKKPKNKMPQTYHAEVWSSDDETFISGFNNPNALCNAVQFSLGQTQEVNIYYLHNSTWLQFTGPRPANPPGR